MCSQYCLQPTPARCKQCQAKAPAVWSIALGCSECFTAEELQLELCRACHTSTRDMPDKALPSYEEACQARFEHLYQEACITGDEAALVLNPLLGGYRDPAEALHMPSTLPAYSEQPEYIQPQNHCALCLRVCVMPQPPLESLPAHRGVHPAVVAHAVEYHGLQDADAYRRAVLARVKEGWPVPVAAQVQRMSVDRYLERLRDVNYSMGHCACCACVEYVKDLTQCEFPSRSCRQKPAWINVKADRWNQPVSSDAGGARICGGERWFDQVRALLHVRSYEET